jgi:DNA-binding MarR family transcriptional regulator
MPKNDQISRIVGLIFAVRHLMHEKIAREKEKKVSFLHVITLCFIKSKKPTMKEIADYLAITAPSATALVNNLIKDKIVAREEKENDRRIVRAMITKKGEAYLKSSAEEVSRRIRNNLEMLTKKEQEDLARILGKVAKHLRNKN